MSLSQFLKPDGYNRQTVSAAHPFPTTSGSGLAISSVEGEGNLVDLSGSTVLAGSLSFTANAQYAVIDTQGFEGAAFTISGFGTANLAVQWSNLPTSGFVAGLVGTVGTTSTATTVTANGQYTASGGGRYMKILVTAFTTGPIVVTPVLLAGASTGSSSGGGSTGATAAAEGTVVVVAGTDKPQAIDLFSSTAVLVKDNLGAVVDWTLPVGIFGADGATIASNANPFPISDAGGSLTIDGSLTNISGTISLPTGAATAAKQPALGTAGTSSADVITVQGVASMTALQVAQATAASLNATVVGSGPVTNGTAQAGSQLAAGMYNSTPPTATAGQQVPIQMGTRGSINVTLFGQDATTTPAIATAGGDDNPNARAGYYSHSYTYNFDGTTWDRIRGISGSFGAATGVMAVEQAGATYVHLTATGAVKSGAGILHKIIVNTLSAGAITVYDNTAASGTVIAIINGGVERDITYDLGFSTGCHLGITGTPDVTVVYR